MPHTFSRGEARGRERLGNRNTENPRLRIELSADLDVDVADAERRCERRRVFPRRPAYAWAGIRRRRTGGAGRLISRARAMSIAAASGDWPADCDCSKISPR